MTVRFPEDKIKQAILRPELNIRTRATSYFARSFSDDPSLMAQVIKAVETYGRQEAYSLVGASRDLRQTDESIAWVIDELNDEQSDRYENYTSNLSMVLVQADPILLLPRESIIREARHFPSYLHQALDERLRMLSWDEATCWRELEAFCEQAKDVQYVNEVDLDHANRIVEALARFGQGCEEKVHALLGQKIEDYRGNPMGWMEPLVARLAGQAHLDSAIPLLVTKLLEDGGDLLNPECAQAMTRIGTPAVLHAIAEAFPGAGFHFRLYTNEPLGDIHSDFAVETCLHLLGQEQDTRIQSHLAQALLSQFALEGIDAARRLLLGRELDFEGRDLRTWLLETCALMGERFPEYDQWLAEEQAEKEEHWKWVKEFESDPERLVAYAFGRLAGKSPAEAGKAIPPVPVPAQPRPAPPRLPERRQKVGRNDPCPCGSGKKFKKCCGRR